MSLRRLFAARGQALVETVALTPLVLLVGLCGAQALICGAGFVQAGHVAHAAALAGQLGHEPLPAARRAAPGWSTGRLDVRVRARRVEVELRPRSLLPGVSSLLVARASARWSGS